MEINQFLEQDKKKVIAEHRAAMACLSISEHALMLGDLKKAERYAIDYIKSVRELKRMEQRKVDREKLVEVTERLKSQGILSAIVMKI
ncbi:hypothetical protein NSS71_11415 [Niallia sp. FSL W8-0951]|jgi:hypothetical protein|uniref:hypothetical protein n=1 Tax=Niallia TaxID=2837506 RepID=UPI0030F795E9